MLKPPHFRPSVLAAKQRLTEERARLREQHEAGAAGVQLGARLAEMLDAVVRDLFDAALAEAGEDLRGAVALVPHGGTGRRDVSPYSDLDLMILHDSPGIVRIEALATRMMQDLYDAGLDPGHSVRTASEAVALARDDASICTSLIESRFLVGAEPLFTRFREQFLKSTQRRYRNRYEAIVLARREERAQYGETMFLLAPNVKRSRGALREIQLLRWIGFCKFGTADPDALHLRGALSKQDIRRLHAAREFLLRLRNDLHFHAESPQDVLSRGEQLRLAEKFGYRGGEGMLPVEQFMREYFQHTGQVRSLVSRFVKSVAPQPIVAWSLAPMFSHQVEGDYRVSRTAISATKRGLDKLKTDLDEVLRLADLANLYDKRIDHGTWEAVYRAAPNYSREINDDVAHRFLSLLRQPARLAELLRRLHELRVLEKIVPAFEHARCLLQFNQYHKYTVDEHCFRAVQQATVLQDAEGPLGDAYRAVKQKRVLHLALLLHDLGKGFAEDHSEVGLRIAAETCARLKLSPPETEQVKFLVHKHLTMSHLAFRRDTSDPQLIVRFAVEVGSPELLKMLYVLSCADLAAVGPGVLNDWKVEVLTDLYYRTLQHLGGGLECEAGASVDVRREKLKAKLPPDLDHEWASQQIDALPAGFYRGRPCEEVLELLDRLRQLRPGQAQAWGAYNRDTQTIEYTIIVDQGHGQGVFSKLTGALTSQRLEVLSAEINSLGSETILDCFVVRDPDASGEPSPDRIDRACQALIRAACSDQPPTFRRTWGENRRQECGELSPLSTKIKFDNNASDKYTIIEVFTFDRMGLLYSIARALYELKLSIGAARIGTYLDQVVDVFYVTEQENGAKIEDEGRLNDIREKLLEAVQGETSDATAANEGNG
jgi:[protein-PII] uridylyltransferase